MSFLTLSLMNVSAQNAGILDDMFRKMEAIMPNQVRKIRANYGKQGRCDRRPWQYRNPLGGYLRRL